MSNRTFNARLYLNIRPNRKPWDFIQWLERCRNLINASHCRVNGWPGTRALLRDVRGFRYRLERMSAVVGIQWPIWRGHGKAALSGTLPFQTHLIILVSVSSGAHARLQIAWAGISNRLIVKLEKKMVTFLLRWPFKCSLSPRVPWVSLWAFPLGSSSISLFAGMAWPC